MPRVDDAAVGRIEGGNAVEVKTCPFCGAAPKLQEVRMVRRLFFSYQCMNESCAVNPGTDLFKTADEAAKVWNTRQRVSTGA